MINNKTLNKVSKVQLIFLLGSQAQFTSLPSVLYSYSSSTNSPQPVLNTLPQEHLGVCYSLYQDHFHPPPSSFPCIALTLSSRSPFNHQFLGGDFPQLLDETTFLLCIPWHYLPLPCHLRCLEVFIYVNILNVYFQFWSTDLVSRETMCILNTSVYLESAVHPMCNKYLLNICGITSSK